MIAVSAFLLATLQKLVTRKGMPAHSYSDSPFSGTSSSAGVAYNPAVSSLSGGTGAVRSPRLGPMSPNPLKLPVESAGPPRGDFGGSPRESRDASKYNGSGMAVLPSPARAFQPLGGSGGGGGGGASNGRASQSFEDLVMPTSYAHSIRSSARMEVGSPGVHVPSTESLGRSPARLSYGGGGGAGGLVGYDPALARGTGYTGYTGYSAAPPSYGASGGYMPSPPARPIVDRGGVVNDGGRGRKLKQAMSPQTY